MKKYYKAVCSSKKLSKRPLRRIISSTDNWAELRSQIQDEEDIEPGYSLSEMTDAGYALQDICLDVESARNMYSESNARGGIGDLEFIVDDEDKGPYTVFTIDVNDFNTSVTDLAIQSDSESEFKDRYGAFLDRWM